MAEHVKKRSRVQQLHRTEEHLMFFGFPIGDYTMSGNFTSTEETTSEGHPWPPPVTSPTSTSLLDRGGPFLNRKVRIQKLHTPTIDVKIPGGFYAGSRLSGRVGSNFWPNSLALLSIGSDADLLAKGTTAVANCNPLQSQAQLGTVLGELREGLPSLVGSQFFKKEAKRLKAAGSEYLNIEFGWKPLIKDLRDSVKALDSASTILAQLSRDSGKPVRRRFSFPLVEEVTQDNMGGDSTSANVQSDYFAVPGVTTRRVVVRRKVWFSGSFLYYLPNGTDFLSKLGRWQVEAHRLLGLRLDPELLWNLAPWTWLGDWFSNAGDLVSNASSYLFDGLVMQYGYIMEHVEETVSYDSIFRFSDGTTAAPQLTLVRETKRRLAATPFGFGLDVGTLDAWQLSILAALGISRKA